MSALRESPSKITHRNSMSRVTGELVWNSWLQQHPNHGEPKNTK